MTKQLFVQDFQKKLFDKFPSGFQSWWPNFIFHYSDITNIKSILSGGKLYSRLKAEELQVMQNDNANDDVIGNTSDKFKDYVRCYFGAKTPTQYQNEGIKPKDSIINNAHCPVPVFLLFDFVKIMSLDDILFSGGNVAAAGAEIYDNIENLNNLEFDNIYHREALPMDANKGHIVYCRHAEVLIKNELDLYEYLKFVCVRSEAEKETLLYGLDDTVKEKLMGKIKVFNQDGIFFNDRLFVESVELVSQKIIFHFSNASDNEFTIKVFGKDNSSGEEFEKSKTTKLAKNLHWEFESDIGEKGFYIRIEINDNLVYENILVSHSEGIL